MPSADAGLFTRRGPSSRLDPADEPCGSLDGERFIQNEEAKDYEGRVRARMSVTSLGGNSCYGTASRIAALEKMARKEGGGGGRGEREEEEEENTHTRNFDVACICGWSSARETWINRTVRLPWKRADP